jgi:hypothetical protein
MQTIAVPAAVIPRLREGAYLQLAHAAEAIKAACEYYEKDEPPLAARGASDRDVGAVRSARVDRRGAREGRA